MSQLTGSFGRKEEREIVYITFGHDSQKLPQCMCSKLYYLYVGDIFIFNTSSPLSIKSGCNVLVVELGPVLHLSTRMLDLPLARKIWSPRALSLSLPVTSSPRLQPVTSDPHWCSWFRGSAAPLHTSHTHTLPSVEPLNTRGPWDCREREDHNPRGLKKIELQQK